MPAELPPMCPQCGRRPQDCTTTVRMAWEAQDETLCPLCVRHWAKTGPNPVGTRCAGCGRKTSALRGDLCSRCRAIGVEVMPLFGDPLPTDGPPCGAGEIDPRTGRIGWRCVEPLGHLGDHANKNRDRTWANTAHCHTPSA